MPMLQADLFTMVKKSFPDGEIIINDLAGDGDHYQLHIKSSRFKGLSRIAQHRLVYSALDNCMGSALHALALTTESIQE
jgi:stress-induced morphogen